MIVICHTNLCCHSLWSGTPAPVFPGRGQGSSVNSLAGVRFLYLSCWIGAIIALDSFVLDSWKESVLQYIRPVGKISVATMDIRACSAPEGGDILAASDSGHCLSGSLQVSDRSSHRPGLGIRLSGGHRSFSKHSGSGRQGPMDASGRHGERRPFIRRSPG